MTGWLLILGIAANLAGSGAALWKGALTRDGGIAAFAVGLSIYLGLGPAGWSLLMLFFLTSTTLGRVRSERKARATAMHAKGGARDAIQVLANGGIAAVASLVFLATGAEAAVVVFVASLSAANADTWAGEIGMLSPRRPRSVLTLKTVETGMSGGVTTLGIVGAAAGALLIGGAAAVFDLAGAWDGGSAVLFLGPATAAGFLGSFIDSVVGTTLQARYVDSAGRITEHATDSSTLAGGFRWVTNDVVNILSGVGAAVAALLLMPVVG